MTKLRTLFVALFAAAMALGAIAVADAAPSARAASPSAAPGGDGERGGPDDPNCEDGETNDDDAFVDAEDPDCQKPGCQASSQTPNKCFETVDDDGEGPTPGTCANGIDDEPDGFTDGADPDCQAADCVVDGVNTCNEDTDDSVEPAELCIGTEDAGLLTEDTLGEELWNAGLDALAPLTEDPERNGVISGPLGEAFNDAPFDGTPLETIVGDEVPCAIDLLLDETVSPIDP